MVMIMTIIANARPLTLQNHSGKMRMMKVSPRGLVVVVAAAIGPLKDLLTIVKRRKLQWYGHVSRSSGLEKNVLQDTVKRGRRQGRQRKR